MPLVKIDRDMLVEELYGLRAKVDPDNQEARKAVMELVDLVLKAPIENGSARARSRFF